MTDFILYWTYLTLGFILFWGAVISLIALSLWYMGLFIWTKLYFKYFWYNDYKKVSNILKGKNNEKNIG
jgi:hypothetical protein